MVDSNPSSSDTLLNALPVISADGKLRFNPGDVFFNRYVVEEKLGRGACGVVYSARDLIDKKTVALKIQTQDRFGPSPTFTPLHVENVILTQLKTACDHQSSVSGFPEPYHFGLDKHVYVLVFELLGPSIDKITDKYGDALPVETVLVIMDNLITRLERVHSLGFVHRDIKPGNIVLNSTDPPNSGIICMIDFGLSRKYKDGNGKFYPSSTSSSRVGTYDYMSIRSHDMKSVTPLDDMESLGYMAADLLRGNLPWDSLPEISTFNKNRVVRHLKFSTTPELLFHGFPDEFVTYQTAIKALPYGEMPKYNEYKLLFRRLGEKLGIDYDNAYSHVIWNITPE